MLQGNVLASYQEKTGLHKVADGFPCTQSGPGDLRKNICVISLQLTAGMSSLPLLGCLGCHHQISLWDIIWAGSRTLMHWIMSYGLY